MQKKIIALAIAAAFSAPAFADTSNVTIYGVANMSYDLTNNGVVSTNKVSSNQSRLGLKGSEDLGDGLSAVWQIEQLIAMDNAGGTLGTRNTFLGLSSGSMGTVLLGRHDTPYKLATRGFDVFADTIADNRSLMGGASLSTIGATSAGASFDGRQGDVVAYVSPAMGGFTGIIAYVAGAELANAANQTKGSAWSLAGLYGNGPLSANIAYEVHDFGTTTAGGTGTLGPSSALWPAPLTGGNLANLKESAWKLGVGYTMDAFNVNAVYERTSDSIGTALALADTDLLGHSSWYLSGKYSFGSDAVKLAYNTMGNMNAALGAATGAKQWTLGYDHNMGKRTTLYALYTRLSNDANATFGLATTSTGAVATTVAGNDPSAWSFGMKHTF